MKRILTLDQRSDFLFRAAQSLLNTNGFLEVCIYFWGTIDSYKYLTHEVLDEIEKQIHKNSQLLKYQAT